MRQFALWPAFYTSLDCPVGTLWIAASPDGIARVEFGIDELAFCLQLEAAGGEPLPDASELGHVVRQFEDYFAGTRRTFNLPLDLKTTRPFQRAVLEAVRAIPYGAVQSYAQVARAAGKPGAARAAGSAIATNPISLIIPCHRVIRADGTPGEYGPRTFGRQGIAYKKLLLSLEGSAQHLPWT